MQKKAFRTFAAALFMGMLMTVPAFADSATVTGSDVNVRTGPGQAFPVVDSLPKGYNVNVVDQSHGSWYEIEYDGLYGFMSASFLDVVKEDHSDMTQEAEQPEDEAVQAYINAMFVRFRSGPGAAYTILTQYNAGKPLTVLGTAGDWVYCNIDGQDGFVHGNYVTVEEKTQTPEPTVIPTVAPSPIPVQTPVPQPMATVDPYFNGSYVLEPELADWGTPTPVPTPAPAVNAIGQLEPVQTEQTPVEAPQAQQQEAQIVGNYVRFRSGPSTSYPIINTYNKGKSVVVTGIDDEWTACIIDGQQGYVFSSYVGYTTIESAQAVEQAAQQQVQTGAEEQQTAGTGTRVPNGYICGNNVRLRDDCTMSSNVIAELFYGNRVEIRWYEDDWTAIMYNGEIGYVYSKYVKEGSLTAGAGDTTAATETEEPANNVPLEVMQQISSEELGIQIANYALQYLGYNYCWGGASPQTGFDCSGLVYYTYSQFGYTLSRVAADQASNGRHVDELQPGDIICFYSSGSYIGHVGIYIGDNKFVHAANSATGVIVTELAGNYASRGYEVRRIVG